MRVDEQLARPPPSMQRGWSGAEGAERLGKNGCRCGRRRAPGLDGFGTLGVRAWEGGLGGLGNQQVANNTLLFWFGIFCKCVLMSNLQDPLLVCSGYEKSPAVRQAF